MLLSKIRHLDVVSERKTLTLSRLAETFLSLAIDLLVQSIFGKTYYNRKKSQLGVCPSPYIKKQNKAKQTNKKAYIVGVPIQNIIHNDYNVFRNQNHFLFTFYSFFFCLVCHLPFINPCINHLNKCSQMTKKRQSPLMGVDTMTGARKKMQ